MTADPAGTLPADELDPDETGGTTAGLSRVVLTDPQRHIGVPMLLHTPDSLPGPEHAAQFSTDAYLHQTALGRRLLETGDTGDSTSARLLSLNFHAVPPEYRRTAAERIRRVVDLGEPYDPDTGTDGPRVLVAVYDGERSTGRWAAELCRRLGVRAYYFPLRFTALEDGPRLDDDDLAAIAADHELCFHTSTHRAAAEIDEANVDEEVIAPVSRLTRAAGRVPRVAAWRGGARFDADTLGDRTVRALGVTHLVSNWSIEPIPGLDPDTVS